MLGSGKISPIISFHPCLPNLLLLCSILFHNHPLNLFSQTSSHLQHLLPILLLLSTCSPILLPPTQCITLLSHPHLPPMLHTFSVLLLLLLSCLIVLPPIQYLTPTPLLFSPTQCLSLLSHILTMPLFLTYLPHFSPLDPFLHPRSLTLPSPSYLKSFLLTSMMREFSPHHFHCSTHRPALNLEQHFHTQTKCGLGTMLDNKCPDTTLV